MFVRFRYKTVFLFLLTMVLCNVIFTPLLQYAGLSAQHSLFAITSLSAALLTTFISIRLSTAALSKTAVCIRFVLLGAGCTAVTYLAVF
ncbi:MULTISPECIES: hypothetical protein [Priestia]|jgi:hypothetical protein|uniref:Uncharacterized protein n=2 Tax=Priestia megaterium TaxID=1404 RepID=A0AAX6BFJ6_PRIMG|nr:MULTISPECIES: hypothetical protein [Priestia]MCL9633467.1 hypothetical protein [Bacillus zanthoxyli]NHH93863.1 hypothetical protein [Bacillus sp. MB95]AKP75984.1 hypothetical protein AS52_01019 [Priestia megaterium Q3]KML28223.1 hypothetical protein VL11_15925 [Priestia aryabhattai]KMO01772.1 hypothetical protein ABV89_01920 [Priestia aryabhattai]